MSYAIIFMNKDNLIRFGKHLLFWLCVFTYFLVTANMVFFKDYQHLLENTITLITPQIIIAYLLLYLYIPKFLFNKKPLVFGLLTTGSLILLFMGYMAVGKYHFDVTYIAAYNEIARIHAQKPYIEGLLDFGTFFSKMVLFLTPAALLFAYKLYKNQQEMLQLREQKRSADLTALKNQLNPHFLFNTLNNLYALALERSHKTPEVIERLSEMLDYMLYRCKDNFVPLHKEVELIENYLALEKLRYGKRVQIAFNHHVNTDIKIAPLLLLTFIENAFKHGVSQELKLAEIGITLKTDSKYIDFSVHNTVPKNSKNPIVQNDDALGLINIKKQLNLLYGSDYELLLDDTGNHFSVQLKLRVRDL